MKRVSLKNKILRYLKDRPNEWINGGEIERYAMSLFFKASNASRRCRELAEEKRIESKIENKTVWYRYTTSFYEDFHAKFQQQSLYASR